MRKLYAYILLFGVFIGCADDNSKKEHETTQKKLDSLSIVLRKEKASSDSLQELFRRADSTVGGYPIFFGRKYENIENPEEYIKEELLQQPEIIPLNPVLGGKMQFREIEVLTESWLLAIYDDGHIQGKAIIGYELQPDDSMEYRIIATQE